MQDLRGVKVQFASQTIEYNIRRVSCIAQPLVVETCESTVRVRGVAVWFPSALTLANEAV